MSEDLHEATFDWFHPEASEVIVTGTFDNWSSSAKLEKFANGFEAKIKLPYDSKTLYKYVVDGRWTTDPTKPTEQDHEGNVNNVYQAPSKHAAPLVAAAGAMPPTALQSAVDSTKATVAKVGAAMEPATSNAKAVDLHPSETPAAPLLDAASNMPPTTAQSALDKVTTTAADVHATHIAPAMASAKQATLDAHEAHVAPVIASAQEKVAAIHETHVAPVIASAQEQATAIHETHVAPAIASVQASIPEGTADKAKEIATAAGAAAIGAAAMAHEKVVVPAVAAIPEEHKATLNTNVIEPVKAALPSAETTGEGSAVVQDAIAYVASGLGAAIKTVTGIDPINVDKIPVQTPAVEKTADMGGVTTLPSKPVEETIAPGAVSSAPPAVVVPATTAENNASLGANTTTVDVAASPAAAPTVAPIEKEQAPAPAAPAKDEASVTTDTSKKAFPSTESGSNSVPPSPAKSSKSTVRKKRESFFGKIKSVFSHDKEKKASE